MDGEVTYEQLRQAIFAEIAARELDCYSVEVAYVHRFRSHWLGQGDSLWLAVNYPGDFIGAKAEMSDAEFREIGPARAAAALVAEIMDILSHD